MITFLRMLARRTFGGKVAHIGLNKASAGVVLVCNTAWAIYTYRRGVLEMLLNQGIPVTVLAPRDRTFQAMIDMGITCRDIRIASKGTHPGTDLLTLLALYRAYRSIRPSVVFHYTIKPNIYGSIAAKLAGIPSVAVTTGLGYVFIQRSRTAALAKRLYRVAFRFPREVWFLNKDDLATFENQKLLAHPRRASILRGEGIDLNEFSLTPLQKNRTFKFILIGRLLWDKGVGEYVEAARRVRISYPHARFQLLGPVGADNPSAIDRVDVERWVTEGVVEYLGEAEDVRVHIQAADCVVLPSYREGVPRTLMEACAMGRPVIATDVPGCREIIDHRVNGLLCTARSAESLVEKFAEMLDMSGNERLAMARKGREKMVKEFDQTDVVARYKKVIGTFSDKSLG